MKLLRPGKRSLAAACFAVFIVTAGGSAALAATADSATDTHSDNGVNYRDFSRISTTSSNAQAQTWEGPTNKSAPSGWIGVDARLYTSGGSLRCSSGIKYNPNSVAQNSYYLATCTTTTHGTYYSFGVGYAYQSGGGYEGYATYKSPSLNY